MKKILVSLIGAYRRFISPVKKPCCRFYPSCSEYAIEAIETYGAFKGTAMAIWRVLRCNPFCKGGYDPVKAPVKRRREK